MGCRARHSCPGAPCPAGGRHVKETRSDIFAPHPALSGKKGPQCSPSWACGLTVTRLLVTGPRLPPPSHSGAEPLIPELSGQHEDQTAICVDHLRDS